MTDGTRFALVLLLACVGTFVDAQMDPRFVGQPARSVDGRISRSMSEKARFVRLHPCPSTGQVSGACPGWAVDHVVPLACGGADAVGNMQWLPLSIKSCAGSQCKDRWERKVYRTEFAC